MKTTWTVSAVAFALAVSFLTVEAQAGGHSMGGSRPASSGFASGRSSASMGGNKISAVQNFRQNNLSSSIIKPSGSTALNQNGLNGSNKVAQSNKLSQGNKQLASNLDKGFDKSKNGKGSKSNWCKDKKWCKDKCCWGFGWCGWCGWSGWDECCDGGYCCDPSYYNPCCYTAEAAVPDFVPARRIARIVNPAENQATLGFAINGQTYSLDAGKTQDVELTDNMVVEFDRGSDNTGRYSLSDGVYTFGSTPQGWELYHSSDAPLTDSVAAN